MVDDGAHFRANHPSVIHETIENEVIIVNLDSGSYYSLDEVGADLWFLLTSGLSVAEIAPRIKAQYEDEHGNIDDALHSFVAELWQEQLIVLDEIGAGPEAIAPRPPGKGRAFAAPRLNKYTDMQDLLLLDPIHDVDETGWPEAKPLNV